MNWVAGYDVGRLDVRLEIAAHLESLTRAQIRLAAGELSAQEMRAVLAVLAWQAKMIREMK